MNSPFASDERLGLAHKARLRHDRLTGRDMLLYPERGLALNPVASAIARLCDGTRTLGELMAELHASYPDVERKELERDVTGFLEQLRSRGLLESHRG